MRATTLPLLGILLFSAISCSSGPELPQPSGRRFEVYMRDAKTLEVEGKAVLIEDFVEAMRKQSQNAKMGKGQAPYVVINLKPIDAPGFLDRLLEDLRLAGVQAIDIQD